MKSKSLHHRHGPLLQTEQLQMHRREMMTFSAAKPRFFNIPGYFGQPKRRIRIHLKTSGTHPCPATSRNGLNLPQQDLHAHRLQIRHKSGVGFL
ncbi:MAG: hypothetical protein NTU84_03150, partial [Verrucomicrobia bacterium]|nr:hypothetical protein [Verrucomicrobiota bacterium]